MTQLSGVTGFFSGRGMAVKLLGLLLVVTAASFAISEGTYSISELTVRNVPATKPDGRAWDVMNSPPDLAVLLYISNYGNNYLQNTWGTKQDCGTSATWSSTCELHFSRDLTEGEQAFLKFVVGDDDFGEPDLIEVATISFQDLRLGENEIVCPRGTEVSFVLDYCGEEEGGFDYVDTIRPGVVESVGEASRTRNLRESDLEALSYREIKLVRNYSYACYDRPFGVRWIREFFEDNMPGYRGNGPDDPNLNSIERDNISFIQEYERDNNIPVINN